VICTYFYIIYQQRYKQIDRLTWLLFRVSWAVFQNLQNFKILLNNAQAHFQGISLQATIKHHNPNPNPIYIGPSQLLFISDLLLVNLFPENVPEHYLIKSWNFVNFEITLPWAGFELITFVLIGTYCIGSCNTNYHMTTTAS
jgi:hypothetical protein